MLRRNVFIAAPALGLAVALASTALAGETTNKPENAAVMHEHGHGSGAIVDKVANARTAADHEAVAGWFEQEAARFDAQAALHEKLARTYRTGGAPKGARRDTMARHCDRLVKEYKDAARTNREMAAMHRQMAKEGSR